LSTPYTRRGGASKARLDLAATPANDDPDLLREVLADILDAALRYTGTRLETREDT
jgi:signal transduction histidine kinase